jgi:chromosome segregation ATPase
MARQFQERFQKALYQRVVEVRQARQALADSQQENAGLRKAQEQLEKMLHAREEENNNLLLENQSLAKERDGLTALVSKLNRELDEINEVLQDASAEESTRQWEKVRLEERIKRLESLLQEQQRINQVLRQESDETLRRLESLRSAQVREKADKAVKN